jgi:RNAse (barnase) inhibitor barstar
MELKPGLHRTGVLDIEATRCQAEHAGYTMFVLPAEHIVDRASFFDAIRATFPLDPPLVGSRSWDALSDSLWEGLSTHHARRIAILWPSTRAMASASSSDFEIALNVLADVANSLADPRATCGNPKEIAVLVE